MSILFGRSQGRSSSRNLVEFKAGKMVMKEGSMVHPIKKKGLVYVHQSDDSLIHFCWKDRTTGAVDDDLIIFPDDTEYKRVPQCTTGRVYVLKFKSTSRRLFFWMQEPETDKDDEFCRKVNEYLNNPPAPGSSRSGGSTPGSIGLPAELSGDGDLQNLLSNVSQQQLMQIFGGVGGLSGLNALLGNRASVNSSTNAARASDSFPSALTTAVPSLGISQQGSVPLTTAAPTAPVATTITASTTPATPANTTTSGGGAVQLSDLQNILANIAVPPAAERREPTAIDLSSSFTAEALQPMLTNPEFMQRLRALLPEVPTDQDMVVEGAANSDDLRSTLQSPQFQQSMSLFSAAFGSGQLGPLMHQFGLSPEAIEASNNGDLEAFVRALQANPPKDESKEDDDKNMDLD